MRSLYRWCLATMLLALPTFAASSSRELGKDWHLAKAAIEDWDIIGARKIVNSLSASHPDVKPVQELAAQVRFEEGDYAGAVALLDAPGVESDHQFAALARATLKETRNYRTQESAHFVFSFRAGKDAVLVPYALDTLERQYQALVAEFDFVPREKIRVEVLDDAHALARVSPLSIESIKTSGTIALCKYNRLMIVSPKALLFGYGWQDTLAHEYVHWVVSKMSHNNVPVWIHEGLAKYFESSWRGKSGGNLSPASAALLAEALKKKKLIPFERMHPSMALLPSQEDAALAFAEVFTAIEYLYSQGGASLIIKLIDALKAGDHYQAAVAKATQASYERFQKDWKTYLAKREFSKETISLSIEKLKFKEDEKQPKTPTKSKDLKDEEIRFGDFLEIEDVQGRKSAHLGELLRQRHRHRAAVAEFAKAYARVKNRSPALSNRYAQALIGAGDLARAEQILSASLKPFPSMAKTYHHLAQVYVATKRPALAEKALLEVVAIDPFDPLPHSELAQIYADRKNESGVNREKSALQILAGQ